MRTLSHLTLVALIALVLGGSTALAQAPAKADPQTLDAAYERIWLHVNNTYTGTLPPDWDKSRQNFKGHLGSVPALIGAMNTILTESHDPRLRILNAAQIEEYKCHVGNGYVGIGTRFKPLNLVNEGLTVKKIHPASNAADSAPGLAGMVIRSIDGRKLEDMRWEEAEALFAGKAGSEMRILATSSTGGKEIEFRIVRDTSRPLGIDVELHKPLRLFEIDWVRHDSPAHKAGVKNNDIVTHINGIAVDGNSLSWVMSQTDGRLDESISLRIKRDGKSLTFEMKRGVVENWRDSFAMRSQNYDGPDGKGFCEVHMQNLDWAGFLAITEEHWHEAPSLILDLRGASGDDPELAAMLLSRYFDNGTVLTYSNKSGETVKYFVAEKDGNRLFRSNGSTVVEVLRPKQQLTAKIVVIIDGKTRGTALAIAHTLQATRRASLVGSTSNGSNELVTTTVFAVEGQNVYVQVPSGVLLDANSAPIESVVPDRQTYWGDPMETAKDALADRYWYHDPFYIVGAVMLLILWVIYIYAVWIYRVVPANNQPIEEGEEPLEPAQKRVVVVVVVLFVAGLILLGMLMKMASDFPIGSTASFAVELRCDPERHQAEIEQFQQLEQEMVGPITFKVVHHEDAHSWSVPGINVRYEWTAPSGKVVSSGSMGGGVSNKHDMVEVIRMAEGNLQHGVQQLVVWNRQTPVLIDDTK